MSWNNRIIGIKKVSHHFLSHSYLILTDSCGIQEEALSHGKSVLVMRDMTESTENRCGNAEAGWYEWGCDLPEFL